MAEARGRAAFRNQRVVLIHKYQVRDLPRVIVCSNLGVRAITALRALTIFCTVAWSYGRTRAVHCFPLHILIVLETATLEMTFVVLIQLAKYSD